jgi:hypothetical protein
VNTEPERCPRCGSSDILGELRCGPVSGRADLLGAWEVCSACGAEWRPVDDAPTPTDEDWERRLDETATKLVDALAARQRRRDQAERERLLRELDELGSDE